MPVPKKVAGVDVLLKVKDGASYIVAGGQTNCTLNREADTIEVTDKTSGGWASVLAGIKKWSVDCDGFVVLGDQALELLENAFENRTLVDVEIRVGANDDTDGVTFTGQGYIVDFPLEFKQDDAVAYSISVEGASPLTRVKGVVGS